ncbi:MAG TPA: ribosome maturation factor RimM [Gemmatimonadaceae bacterium]|nr:ribosome maturation factor RimM [Gemmatimonadaceae bacterium]
MAHVRRAHGLRGELLVRPLTAQPETLFTEGRRFFAGANGASQLVLQGARTTNGGWLLAFAEIPDRSTAERWRGVDLWAAEEDTAALGGTPYAGDLVGLSLELVDGTVIGRVANYYELPQGPLLEVARGEELVLFPLHPEFVQRIDTTRRAIIVDPPTGLFD